ncbi:MAG TPA: DEAD/DEAH box helicase [Thermoanaerobaculia bacterium]|nr:DEAD/DEAH box helicase [Thermoanaerobaculia bacterium]
MPAFTHLEFHRTGIGLVPDGPGSPHTAIYVASVPGSGTLRSCTCAVSKHKTCDHLKDLSKAVAEVERAFAARSWEAAFEASVWYRLARLLFEGNPQASAKVRVLRVPREPAPVIRVTAPAGDELAEYLDASPARLRFLERTGKAAPDGERIFDRAGLLERLALFQATEQERMFHKAGMKTQRQTWEESFWHRLAYHCVREAETAGEARGTFHPAIDESSGRFTFTYRRPDGEAVVRFVVPRDRVRAALQLLAAEYPEQADLAIRPIPLQSIFRVTQETELDLEVRPVIRALQANGETRFFEHRDFAKFRYGNLVWIKELGILAELEREGKERKFKSPVHMRLQRSQVPSYLAEHAEALDKGLLVLDDPLRDRRVFTHQDHIEISLLDLEAALERSWFWLALQYGFGSDAVSLAELLRAKREGLPYLETAEGWIDLNAPAFRELDRLAEAVKDGRFRFPASELLRLQAAAGSAVRVAGEDEGAAKLVRLLELRPAAPFAGARGISTPLRQYQKHGVDWLLFLYQNRLAGLLCDDMGLGKTLQVLALLVTLLERGEVAEPFLVACPTSVLSHWRNQIERHAPGLKPVLHHGAQRRLAGKLQRGDVLVTSYGVLRRDAEALSAIPFALAVFDEAQHLKNRGTQSWQAADHLVADVKLGLTGTPVENSLGELKALFDLILPGYLGSDTAFLERFVKTAPASPLERDAPRPGERLAELRRVISPFVLRRLKTSVLDELPEKIEDVRTCALSADQVQLYRDAVAGRGAELAREIEQAADGHIPYLHVFAVLTLLKKICDHPALALGDLGRAGELASGKWDLYREILDEALGSGQKVVVFSQYLGMIELMARHLEGLGVGFVRLTGSSVRRGEIVDRFNLDPDCRVFLGSLKAGGTGIDLVGGSVVIHYDRWWNAAKEDQATDRVYRLGQKRAVQVFKLVTEGTLEEKIAALIERKREVMASVVQEDSAELAKIFSREELLEMLRDPGASDGGVRARRGNPIGSGFRYR